MENEPQNLKIFGATAPEGTLEPKNPEPYFFLKKKHFFPYGSGGFPRKMIPTLVGFRRDSPTVEIQYVRQEGRKEGIKELITKVTTGQAITLRI